MYRLARALCILSVLLLSCTAAFGDIVVGTSGNAWQAWPTSGVTPYWTGNSSDVPKVNVGDCLIGNCTMATAGPGSIPYWGASNGAADASFYLQTDVPVSGHLGTLEVELAGNAGINAFGWYEVSTGATHQLFAGGATLSATASFTPTANYGFYFTGSGAGNTWYTQSALNSVGQRSDQHFAVFQQTAPTSIYYWLGMEDLPFSGSDKDYQDMIVKVSTPASTNIHVPEPTSILSLIVMLGVAGIGWRARRPTA
jgi:hypothetical protein